MEGIFRYTMFLQ